MPLNSDNIDALLLEMRWRVLSLAADFDRLQRHNVADHPRLAPLRKAIGVLHENSASPDRAAQVQMIFSDKTPPPKHRS